VSIFFRGRMADPPAEDDLDGVDSLLALDCPAAEGASPLTDMTDFFGLLSEPAVKPPPSAPIVPMAVPFDLGPFPVLPSGPPSFFATPMGAPLEGFGFPTPDVAVAALLTQLLPDPVVSNVLCTCHLGIKVDTLQIARRLWNVERNERHGALTMKCPRSRVSVSVYPSGKMTCVGAQSEDAARRALRQHCRLIQQSIRSHELPDGKGPNADTGDAAVYHRARFCNFRVHNVKAEWKLGFPVDLHSFHEQYGSYLSVYYEPSIFPALKLTLPEPKLTAQIFANGTVGITGATSFADVAFACKEVLYPLAKPCTLKPVLRR